MYGFKTEFALGWDSTPWVPDGFKAEVKRPGGDWQPASFGTGDGGFYGSGDKRRTVATGTYDLAGPESLTIQVRLTATDAAALGFYGPVAYGRSDLLDNETGKFVDDPTGEVVAKPSDSFGKGTCTQYWGAANGYFKVIDTPSPTPTPSPTTPKPTPTPTLNPGTTAVASPSASSAVEARPVSAALAETGAGNTLPIAAAGVATLALGGGFLFVVRRRKGTHS